MEDPTCCSSLMTDCHMTRRKRERGAKEEEGEKEKGRERKGRKSNFVTYKLLLKQYPLVTYSDTYTLCTCT